MTDDDKALVERLRNSDFYDDNAAYWLPDYWLPDAGKADALCEQAADRIEALSAENERLCEALGWFLNDSRFTIQVGGNPNVVPQMIEAARAALGEKK